MFLYYIKHQSYYTNEQHDMIVVEKDVWVMSWKMTEEGKITKVGS